MVTGPGSEALLSFGGVEGLGGAARHVQGTPARPFSANRTGMVQGDGAPSSSSKHVTSIAPQAAAP